MGVTQKIIFPKDDKLIIKNTRFVDKKLGGRVVYLIAFFTRVVINNNNCN